MYIAWFYVDRENDIIYWTHSYEMSTTNFATIVSEKTGLKLSAGEVYAAKKKSDLRYESAQMVHITKDD